MSWQKQEQCWTKDSWQMKQERDWKNGKGCEELKPKQKDKLIFVDQKRDGKIDV